MAVANMEQVLLPDGRVELDPGVDESLGTSGLHNEDLAPVPIAKRTWTTYNYLALWIGMSVNVPTWFLAAALVGQGMAWYQVILVMFLANVIVLIPMLLISHAGTKYGIPFPVVARASFGTYGANLPALMRAGVACGWFGIQTWIGGSAVFVVIGALLGPDSWWVTADKISIGIGGAASQPWTMWLSFALFWALNMLIILRGMQAIRRFENWAAPFLIVVFLVLMVWMISQAGGLGPVVENPGTLGWGPEFWAILPISLMANIAFWSTLSLNMPDFTRFGRSQRDQTIGQTIGLPSSMTLFPLIGVLTASATVVVYGEAIWDPSLLASKMDNPILLAILLLALALATLTTNVAANVVSPSYDFSNAWPKRISFKMGGVITGILGILFMPWNFLADSSSYIFTWLGTYGGATGPIAGVLIADYWWVRRRQLKLADLYRNSGKYRYASGWNWIAVVSLLVGVVIAIGGAYSKLNADGSPSGPFPPDGIIPFLKGFYDFSWLIGLVVAFVLYGVLTMVAGNKEATTED
jgi:NCS1 family nucleobase:cation symporter-1